MFDLYLYWRHKEGMFHWMLGNCPCHREGKLFKKESFYCSWLSLITSLLAFVRESVEKTTKQVRVRAWHQARACTTVWKGFFISVAENGVHLGSLESISRDIYLTGLPVLHELLTFLLCFLSSLSTLTGNKRYTQASAGNNGVTDRSSANQNHSPSLRNNEERKHHTSLWQWCNTYIQVKLALDWCGVVPLTYWKSPSQPLKPESRNGERVFGREFFWKSVFYKSNCWL